MEKNRDWEWEIKANSGWFGLNMKEISHYKDLLFRFVRRDIIASYQQTVLGPLWVFLQPLLTTAVYFIVFRKIAKIPTGGIPPVLFYLPGIIIWTYFSDCLSAIMYTFLHNAYIFNKVYFPRLVVPFSKILFNAFRLSIQLLLYLTVYVFFMWFYKEVRPTAYLLLLPLMIVVTSAFALGAGLLISVLTARYRDLDNILQFLIRLFMFATPVVYPVALVPEKYQFWFWLNPLTPVIESFRAAFFQTAAFETKYLFLSVLSTGILLMAGLLLFRKKEIEIMDII